MPQFVIYNDIKLQTEKSNIIPTILQQSIINEIISNTINFISQFPNQDLNKLWWMSSTNSHLVIVNINIDDEKNVCKY